MRSNRLHISSVQLASNRFKCFSFRFVDLNESQQPILNSIQFTYYSPNSVPEVWATVNFRYYSRPTRFCSNREEFSPELICTSALGKCSTEPPARIWSHHVLPICCMWHWHRKKPGPCAHFTFPTHEVWEKLLCNREIPEHKNALWNELKD